MNHVCVEWIELREVSSNKVTNAICELPSSFHFGSSQVELIYLHTHLRQAIGECTYAFGYFYATFQSAFDDLRRRKKKEKIK